MRSFFCKIKKIHLAVFALIIFMAGSLAVSLAFSKEIVSAASLLLSEVKIGGGPGKTAEDYVKICNVSTDSVDLKGNRLVKRTKTGTSDTGLKSWTDSVSVAPNSCHVWANSNYATAINADSSTSGTLAEDNCLAIRNGAEDTGSIIDALAWGECTSLMEGQGVLNPEATQIIKRTNNQDTDNNSADFTLVSVEGLPEASSTASTTETVTPSPSGGSSSGGSSSSAYLSANSDKLKINEIMATPLAGEKEWVELYYSEPGTVSLMGYSLEDASGAITLIAEQINGYLVVETKGSLNNDGDTIYLKNSFGQVVDSMTYGTKLKLVSQSGQSIAKDSTGNWQVSAKVTKGALNVIENKTLDSKAETVEPKEEKNVLIINEVLADPVGSDNSSANQEFIEILNIGDQAVDLKGYVITVDGRQEFQFTKSISIEPNKFYTLKKSESKLSLPNSNGKIKFYAPGKKTAIDSVDYKLENEGSAWAFEKNNNSRIKNDWRETLMPTPDAENVFIDFNRAPVIEVKCPEEVVVNRDFWIELGDSFDLDGDKLSYKLDFADGFISYQSLQDHAYTKPGKYTLKIEVSDGLKIVQKNCPIKVPDPNASTNHASRAKTTVKTTKVTTPKKVTVKKVNTAAKTSAASKVAYKKIVGQVVSLPNEFSSQFFYILPTEGQGWQVYSYNKKFPELKLGEIIEVSGEVSEVSGESRLKTKNESQIKILGEEKEIKAEDKKIAEIISDDLDHVIKIKGQVLNKKGNLFYVDDSSGEMLVSFADGLKPLVKNGDEIELIGIVRQTRGGIRLGVRDLADMQIVKPANDNNENNTSGATTTLPVKHGEEKVIRYLFAIVGFLCIAIGALIYKYQSSNQKNIDEKK
ncbi:MAG: lamin tail domain-containing protein [Patescibacteria group bacterium]|nr:lamin tail domain-containing protein [Patescibacteria group bacterium]